MQLKLINYSTIFLATLAYGSPVISVDRIVELNEETIAELEANGLEINWNTTIRFDLTLGPEEDDVFIPYVICDFVQHYIDWKYIDV